MSDDDAIPILFLMIGLQIVSMLNTNARISQLERVVALDVVQTGKGQREFESLEKEMETFWSDEIKRSQEVRAERNAQYKRLEQAMERKSVDRITRTEIEVWRDDIAKLFPMIPQVPRINAPNEQHPPMLIKQ